MTFVITPETRLKKVLDVYPQLVDYVVALNPHDFARLHNPLMYRLMPPRITLRRLATMVHMPVHELLQQLVARSDATMELETDIPLLPHSPVEPPDWVLAVDAATVQTVDLLPLDETLDSDPLPPVIGAIKGLPLGGVVRIKHKWEPQPFYDMWTKMGGLEWFAEQKSSVEWWIWVRRVP